MSQLHKKFTTEQVKSLFQRYISKEIERKYIQATLGIKKRRFFMILKQYRDNPNTFSVEYERTSKSRSIDPEIEKNIIKELKIDQKTIKNEDIPLYKYNYSFVQQRLKDHYKQDVSLWTVINRAKKNNLYLPKKPRKKAHDREVLTHYVGELIQHDTSFHLWAPDAKEKWYLITSLDDHSRYILYAVLVRKESSWTHIQELQSTILKYGCPFSYYVDCHSIFRYVRGRDQLHNKFTKFTDDVSPQWKQVLEDCNIKPIYALSPQAKGKIERPFGWLQDHLVRTCVRENVKDIKDAQRILNHIVYRYNQRIVHSTTQEIPYRRFQNALSQNNSLFREFVIPKPYLTVKDIFCLRLNRFVDNYHSVAINKIRFKLSGVEPRYPVNIRIYILSDQLSEFRFWYNGKLINKKRVKNDEFLPVHF